MPPSQTRREIQNGRLQDPDQLPRSVGGFDQQTDQHGTSRQLRLHVNGKRLTHACFSTLPKKTSMDEKFKSQAQNCIIVRTISKLSEQLFCCLFLLSIFIPLILSQGKFEGIF